MNSTNQNMTLVDNPLAQALSAAAGPELQAACSNLAPLNSGQVKVTPGFKLECLKVLHCSLPGQYSGTQSEPVSRN